MKIITVVLPDGYDQVVCITAIGTEIKSDHAKIITNVTQKMAQVKDGDVISITGNKKEENSNGNND